jgi:hypothetical protein
MQLSASFSATTTTVSGGPSGVFCMPKQVGWPNADPDQPFYLIVIDNDRGVFAVEGPMTERRPWREAAVYAGKHDRSIALGPTGPDRDELSAEYRRKHNLPGAPPGSIVRPRL